MKNIIFTIILIFCAGKCFAETAPMSGGTSDPQQMLDFNIAGYGAKGEKTWEVQGASMDMEGDDVKISDITAHLYGEEENMVLTADKGKFDRTNGVMKLTDNVKAVTDSGAHLATDSLDWSQKEQLVTTKDQVNITKENMSATGKGVSAQPDFKTAKFDKDVKVVLDQGENADKKEDGAILGSKRTTITCDGPMTLDYNKQFAVFEKNVKVESDTSDGTMLADKMTVTFSPETKQVDKMNAEGHVKIIKGENVSESEGATFTAADKKLVLTGRPKLTFYTEEGMDVSP
ncbi:MAG TPA: LPS export ABC transporter periplasmic protein LptC [Candidatus Omnitrophota bacterium]|nr:LPS export ABC transporter periplasmic protein LptC [Candidatus Omnitrophota bacterium]